MTLLDKIFTALPHVGFYTWFCIVMPIVGVPGNEWWEQLIIGHILFIPACAMIAAFQLIWYDLEKFARRNDK